MADLPVVTLPASTIEIGGQLVDYHSLSRSQALRLGAFTGREDDAEDFLLACGTDRTVEEAHAWRDSVPMEEGGQLVDAIIAISGLSDRDVG